ncbi:hypothetical protein AJ80_09397 [Polytolypa hystricis UAMH7299]|uniref:Uncharacterized protein n=1 Tax=Polytolypa hystricis (strain UAMH7299) TaxID=1447883 RepID=A0A2B7WID4_POLH7|nr:hypothetical protein AJ80_09397 [Polytolypa hystricis UAMH7299]
MALVQRDHGNERRAESRQYCRVHLSRHIYKELGFQIDPEKVRLKPGVNDPYRWLPLPSKEHLLGKQLSKGSLRDYKAICSAIDDSTLKAVSVDDYMRMQTALATRSAGTVKDLKIYGEVMTQNQSDGPADSFATRVTRLTSEIDKLQAAHQESRTRADRAEAALKDKHQELQDTKYLMQAEICDLKGRLQKSRTIADTYREAAQDSSKVIQTLYDAMDAARSQAASTRMFIE